MDTRAWRRHRLSNVAQSLLLLAAMAALLSALGAVLLGDAGIAVALGVVVALIVFGAGVSPAVILRMYGARALGPRDAPELHAMLAALAERAGVPPPRLYYLPSRLINAFAVGRRGDAAIAVSDALLRHLTPAEVHAVLAHEVSHIRHGDMWVMALADLFSRVTGTLSTVGQILLLVNLPLLLFSEYTVSWVAIALLLFAPLLSALLQLALSRAREYDADLGAAELTGDPRALASALARMERYQGRVLEQLLMPGRRVPEPSILRTHPPTERRVERLLSLAPGAPHPPPPRRILPRGLPVSPDALRPPRWHLHGIWY